jgi:ankyrin repeat protein
MLCSKNKRKHSVIAIGYSDVLDCLLKHNEIDLKIKNHDGDTPLMKAASQIKKAEIKRLLGAGCDMHASHHIRGQSLHPAASNVLMNLSSFLAHA